MNKTAWIYCRSATGEYDAIQKQREAALRYAAAHNLEVVGGSNDIGSGVRYDHPGLVEMLGAVRNGLVSAVVMRDLSRIGRNYLRTNDVIVNVFEASGVELLCYTD